MKVQAALDEYGLMTDPPFTGGWIDNYVVVRLAPTSVTDGQDAIPEPAPVEADDEGHVGLTVQSLRSAGAGIVSVERNQDLNLARSLMLKHGYSQLAVMSGRRKLIGAVSWESMAKAALRDPNFTRRRD
ncbi:MAG: CBS domain-containing protein [Thermoleophilia bacterium]